MDVNEHDILSNFTLRHKLSRVYCITSTISSRIFNRYAIL